MLRLLVLGLVLANAAYFLWAQGWLAALGLAPINPSEAFRLDQQIQPEAMLVLPGPATRSSMAASSAASPSTPSSAASSAPSTAPSSAASATASAATPPASGAASAKPPASAATAPVTALATSSASAPPPLAAAATGAECLQAGLFTDAQANALRAKLLLSLPEGSWTLSAVVEPARWIIYMGRYANEDMVAKKRSELRARGVSYEPVQNPALNPGLSLGHFATKAEADAELAKDAQRGVRTARVLLEQSEVRGQRLKLPAADGDLKARLAAIKPQLAGKVWSACR